jgi:UDPglucose 6-dehydrogenase
MDVVAVGGRRDTAELVVNIYTQVLGPEPVYIITDAVTAELAKYMENCFFATKVAFVAQFLLLAQSFGADFTTMREIWACWAVSA